MKGVSRKVGDRLRIGDQVVITVLAVRGQQVQLKISAPESMAIWREEAYQQKDRTSATEQTVEICTWLGQSVLEEPSKDS